MRITRSAARRTLSVVAAAALVGALAACASGSEAGTGSADDEKDSPGFALPAALLALLAVAAVAARRRIP